MQRTAIVILNWNTREHLEKFLPSVIDNSNNADIIVADNGSKDDSVEFLKANYPNIRLICFNENYGFTGGYNRALDIIKSDSYEYYVLLNSDIEVEKNWLDPLINYLDNKSDCAVVAPKLHSYFNRDYFEYAGAAGGYLDAFGFPYCRGRVLGKVEKDEGQYDSSLSVMWVSGACLVIRANLYHKAGGLDERFFAHMEEIDLCWRLQLMGYKVDVVPYSTVYHLGGGTLPNSSPYKLFLNYRNNLLMLDNNLWRTYLISMPYNKAIKKARYKIFQRMCIDGLSAIAYLCLFKFDKFKAVIKAHKEYKKLRHNHVEQTNDLNLMTTSKVIGLTDKLIIPLYFISGNKIFDRLK